MPSRVGSSGTLEKNVTVLPGAWSYEGCIDKCSEHSGACPGRCHQPEEEGKGQELPRMEIADLVGLGAFKAEAYVRFQRIDRSWPGR